MGFVDNSQHPESTRVAFSSNSGHSDGQFWGRQTESGHCASHPGLPKYKRRKVSVIRDFPKGFKRNTTPISAMIDNVHEGADKNSFGQYSTSNGVLDNCHRPSGVSQEDESVGMSHGLNSKPLLMELNLARPKAEGRTNLLHQLNKNELVNVNVAGMQRSEALEGLDSVSVAEPVKVSEYEKLHMSKDLNKVTSPAGEILQRKYPPRRSIYALRDFPKFCGRKAPCIMTQTCAKMLESVEEKNIDHKTLKEDVKQIGDNFQNADVDRGILKEDVSQLNVHQLEAAPEVSVPKQTRTQDDSRAACGSEVKGDQENRLQRWIKYNAESNQNHYDLKSDMDIGDLGEKLMNDFAHPMDNDIVEGKFQENSPENALLVLHMDAEEQSTNSPQGSIQNCQGIMSRVLPQCGDRLMGGFKDHLKKDLTDSAEDLETEFSNSSACQNQKVGKEFNDFAFAMNREVVQGLMAERSCPWRQGKRTDKSSNLTAGIGEGGGKKDTLLLLKQPKATLEAKKKEIKNLEGVCIKKKSSSKGEASECTGQIVRGNDNKLEKEDNCYDYRLVRRRQNLQVSLPPHCTTASNGRDDDSNGAVSRSKVRETLRLFQAICRKLLQEEESKVKEHGNARRRVDLQAAKILKDKGKYVNTGKQIIGPVPGVEVGDEFQYRIELNIIGLHRQIQGGIDYVKQNGTIIATSIVASGGYDDETDESDVLTYMGQGGNMSGGGKDPEDQKLERGNLALKNSKDAKNPVRVIRGDSKMPDSSDSRGRTYIYDGLYLVEKVWQTMGPHEKLVFKFKLVRIPGQPELAWKIVKKSKNIKVREGLCVDDISQGEEKIAICAVNNIDAEKPPPFKYLSRMIYPNWCHPVTPKGCSCTRGCSESSNCSCMEKNGGEIPYNHNGAIVEAKPLVYECGPSCKCPSSCYNRVSQHGIKFQLEIFKTESRGWGVRSLNSIPSGSFICEYIGELLEEKEAERRTGNDEYLFDIGNNYNDKSLWSGLSIPMLDVQASSHEVQKDGSFTIDAAEYGNVGRFINHSCSPNLYAQNVLYDHDDKRMPHIMLFAAENIPPLQELTYHYNYMIDQVFDSDGNIKKKYCYCGSSECSGRMY
ncbi:hypothetical protein K2173_002748 [Erythroxylum novogranatense]|uniref:Uncharacterized protein n=1 Tax=Erythroxylum novogranatense TaxID=1862640 RepID=A0AAV8SPR7_9ROSI|nr:hypothetical protein K2173_002748 [Erythroxylum novogranatense]